MHDRRLAAVGFLSVVTLALASCSGASEPDPLCGVASDELMEKIAAGPESGQVGREIDFDDEVTPVRGATYPYTEGSGAEGTAIAMEFTVPGVEGTVGVWAETSAGGIFVSSAQAETFTAWPKTFTDGTEILPYPSETTTAVEACLEAQSSS